MLHNLLAEFADALNDASIVPTGISPTENMTIHRRNIEAQLVQTLASIYPLFIKLVGNNFFRQLAQAYCKQFPSQHSYLQAYGNYFSQFIAEYPGTSELGYLKEILAFEWAYHQAMIAAEHIAFDVTQLMALAPEALPKLRLQLHPSCQLLSCEYPIFDIIALCTGEREEDVELGGARNYMLLHRPQHSVQVIALNAAEFACLTALSSGQTLQTAVHDAQAIDLDFDLTPKLTPWIKSQIFIDCY